MTEDWLTICKARLPQWHGIWRPPEEGHGGRADGLQQYLTRGDAQRERQRAVAVVGEEPVVARPQRPGEPEQQCLVARARDLEEDAVLLRRAISRSSHGRRDQREPEVVDRLREVRGVE